MSVVGSGGTVPALYQKFFRKSVCPEGVLFYVPSHPARDMDADLEAAGIPEETKEGKLDSHALRTCFVTLAGAAGANIRKAQTLARHSTPELTANVYAKTRNERLAELAEDIGERLLSNENCAAGVPRKPIEATVVNAKSLQINNLDT